MSLRLPDEAVLATRLLIPRGSRTRRAVIAVSFVLTATPSPIATPVGGASEPSSPAACGAAPAREVRNGQITDGPEYVIGRGPLLIAGIRPGTTTPALVNLDGPRLSAKVYFMFAKAARASRVSVRGWRVGDRHARMLIGDDTHRRMSTHLVLRRDDFGPRKAWRNRSARWVYKRGSVAAPEPGCYVVQLTSNGGGSRAVIDLRGLDSAPPRDGGASRR